MTTKEYTVKLSAPFDRGLLTYEVVVSAQSEEEAFEVASELYNDEVENCEGAWDFMDWEVLNEA